MNKNIFEATIGVIVLLLCGMFMTYVVRAGNLAQKNIFGKTLHANFNNIDGISVGSEVKIAGVRVGAINKIELDKNTFQSKVTIHILSSLDIPVDSVLSVTSSGIFGSKYLAIKPGAEEGMIGNNGTFTMTQSSTNLEDLISKFATK